MANTPKGNPSPYSHPLLPFSLATPFYTILLAVSLLFLFAPSAAASTPPDTVTTHPCTPVLIQPPVGPHSSCDTPTLSIVTMPLHGTVSSEGNNEGARDDFGELLPSPPLPRNSSLHGSPSGNNPPLNDPPASHFIPFLAYTPQPLCLPDPLDDFAPYICTDYIGLDSIRIALCCNGVCDTFWILINVTPRPVVDTFVNACDSFVWQNTTLTASGLYTDTLRTVSGCDSTVTLHLTINDAATHNSTATVNDTINTNDLPYIWHGFTFNEPHRNFIAHIPNVAGCDSLVHYNLHVYQMECDDTTVAEGTTQCSRAPLYSNYADYAQRVQSLYQSHMLTHIVGRTIDSLHYQLLDGGPTSWGDAIWNISIGTATRDNLYSSFDNDAVLTQVYSGPLSASTPDGMGIRLDTPFTYTGGHLIIQFSKVIGGSNSQVVFAGTTSAYPGATRWHHSIITNQIFLANGTREDQLPAVTFHYCDEGDLIDCRSFTDTIAAACETFHWRGNDLTLSGSYADSLVNYRGCDSIITLHLTVNHRPDDNSEATVNDTITSLQLPYTWNGITFYGPRRNYNTVIPNASGCDSLIHYNLYVRSIDCRDTTVAQNYEDCLHAPVYGMHGDLQQRVQSVYRSYMLTHLAGKTVDSLHYDLDEGNSLAWGNETWTVSVGITTRSNLYSSFDNTTALTQVYSGPLYATSAHGMGIKLDTPFTYNGGHLLIQFIKTSDDGGYSSTWFNGETPDYVGATRWATTYDGGSLMSLAGTREDQLPAVTFHFCQEGDLIDCRSFSDTVATACSQFLWRGHICDTAGLYYDTLVNTAGCDSILTLHLSRFQPVADPIPGATSSLFSVSSSNQVHFSIGNLQYRPSTGEWRFAPHQYDYIGSNNSNISSYYTDWIDLFAWGTSGWNSGALRYQPYEVSFSTADFYPGGSYENNLSGAYEEADWAYHNPITNGGNMVHQWRTLSQNEWMHLLFHRTTSTNLATPDARFAKARVNNVRGLIIFPDDYSHPAGVTAPVGINQINATGWNSNNYNLTSWNAMEQAGAVFLPAAGQRSGASVTNVGTSGTYWSSTAEMPNSGKGIRFISTMLDDVGLSRYGGWSVRPVMINMADNVAHSCGSYTWNGEEYALSGIYYDTLIDAGGCDSVISLHLTVMDCPEHSMPLYCEDFESYSPNALPPGWNSYRAQNNENILVDASQPRSGSQCLHLNLRNGTTSSYLVMPDLALDSIQQAELYFYYRRDHDMGRLVVGVMEQPGSTLSFTPIDTIINLDAYRYEQHHVSFAGYSGSGRNIAFRYYETRPYPINGYIDDIVVEQQMQPHIALVDSTTVRIEADSRYPTDYWLEYGIEGFRPGGDSATLLHVQQSPYFVTGLLPETSYDFYVYPSVDPLLGTGTSCHSPVTLSTRIRLPLPYCENFDNYLYNGTIGLMPHHWTRYASTASLSRSTPSLNNLYNSVGGKSLRFMPMTGTRICAILPDFHFDSIQQLTVSYDVLYEYNSYYNLWSEFYFGVMDNANDINTFTAIDTLPRNYSWQHYSTDLSRYAGDGRFLAFCAFMRDSSMHTGDNIFLDNVEITYTNGPSFQRSGTSTVDIPASGCPLPIYVEYDTAGFTPGQGTGHLVRVDQLPFTISGLIDGNTYDFYYSTDTAMLACSPQATITMPAIVTVDIDTVLCDSELPFLWRNYSLSAATSISDTVANGSYIDSIFNLTITINSSTTGDTTVTACDSFTWHGTEYTTTTSTPTYTTTNAVGCDSTVTLHLTVNSSTTGDTTVTACNSFTWHGTEYTTSTTPTYTTTNAVGCDSTVTLHLTIKQSTTGTEDTTVCNSLLWHGTEYTTSTTTPTYTTTNAAGCDSTVTLHLTVIACSSTTVTACDSYTWNNTTYTTSGIYTSGNDTLYLTINSSTTGDTTVTACDSFIWHGTEYTASTETPTYTTTNAAGCDSTVTLHLTIIACSSTTVTACDSYIWNNITYTTSGIYTSGSDTLYLTINSSTTGDTTATACDSFTWHGTEYTTTTSTPTYTTTNAAGCDSTVTLHLTIKQSTTGTEDTTVCNSLLWHGTEYTTSTTTPTYTTTNAAGCDSTVNLHLTIIACSSTTVTACDSYTWNNTTYTTSGIYTSGNDTLYLTINYGTTGDTTVTACDSFTWHGTEYTTTTSTPTYTTTNDAGCDSTATLHLTINNSYETVDHIESCGPYTWIDGTTYNATTSSPHVTLVSHHGCDSLVHLDFYFLPVAQSFISDSFCSGSSYIFNGRELSTGGTYSDTLKSSSLCDSIITLNLTMLPLPQLDIEISPDCELHAYNVRVNSSVDFLHWEYDGHPWCSEWGPQSSPSLFVIPQIPISLSLSADYRPSPTCPAFKSLSLSPVVQPVALIKASPQFLSYDQHTLTALNVSSGASSFQWFINGSPMGSDGLLTYSPDIFSSDSLAILLCVASEQCTDTATLIVPIRRSAVYAPNAFTPDESTNQLFLLKMHGITYFDLYIYNRQGLLVFHTTDPEQGWDGTHNGIPCPQQNYVWILDYISAETPGVRQKKKGSVLLLR